MRGIVVSRRMMIDKNRFWLGVSARESDTGSALWRLPRGLSEGEHSPLGMGGALAFIRHLVHLDPVSLRCTVRLLVRILCVWRFRQTSRRFPISCSPARSLIFPLSGAASPSLSIRPHAPLLLRLRQHPLGEVDPLLRLAQLPA